MRSPKRRQKVAARLFLARHSLAPPVHFLGVAVAVAVAAAPQLYVLGSRRVNAALVLEVDRRCGGGQALRGI